MSAKKANEKTGCVAVTEAMVEAWVGAKVFSRAKAIVCNVGEIGQKADGDYVAAVFGGGDFVCSVGLGKDGSFVSECTCEAGCDCEHAAAVMLAVIQAQKAKVTLPTIADGDPRLLRLDDDSQSKKRTLSAGEKKVVAWLESLDARNRLLLLVELMQKHPGVMHDLQQQSVAKGCSDRELIAQTKAAIKNVKDSCDWRRARGERRPDYTPVKECLERLLERGLREPFPMLGELLYTDSEKLFRKFPRHIEDIRVGANEVFKTIVKEVHEGPLSDVEKLLWEHDL